MMMTTTMVASASALSPSALPKVLGSGHWQDAVDGITKVHLWRVGDVVEVQPRTWAGINRPGGHGKISKIHYNDDDEIASIDVKYTLTSGFDRMLDPDLIKPFRELERRTRRPRKQDKEEEEEKKKPQPKPVDKENARLHQQPAVQRVTVEPAEVKKKSKRRALGVMRKTKNKNSNSKNAPQAVVEDVTSSSSLSFPPVPQEICFGSRPYGSGGCGDDDDDMTCVSELALFAEPEQLIRSQSGGVGAPPKPTTAAVASSNPSSRGKRLLTNFLPNRDKRCSNSNSSSSDDRAQVVSAKGMSIGSGDFSARVQSIGSGEFQKAAANDNKNKSLMAVGKRKAESSPPNQKRLVHEASALPVRRQQQTIHHHQVDLAQLYNEDKKRANEFVGEVVDHHHHHQYHQSNNSGPPESMDDTSVTSLSLVGEASRMLVLMDTTTDPRQNQFVALFNSLLQNQDGEMEESTIVHRVNNHLQSQCRDQGHGQHVLFEEAHVQNYLHQLCSQNKIMRSDGWVYGI